MFFQGQEFGASTPFLYFADHKPELAAAVRKGRAQFVSQFPSIAAPDVAHCLADPGAVETFERCRLDLAERERHAEAYALHVDLLRLRREEPAFRAQRGDAIDGAVLGPEAFVLRFFGEDGGDRLLIVNLGRDLHLRAAPEPLLAPPAGCVWRTLWSSEDPRYGGGGTPQIECDDASSKDTWRIVGRAAVVLAPQRGTS